LAQQKLYTEEQVKLMIEKSRATGLTAEFLTLTTPAIELPSDEEIDKKAYNWCQVEHDENGFIRAGDDYDIKELPSFIGGAKWMKEQILKNK